MRFFTVKIYDTSNISDQGYLDLQKKRKRTELKVDNSKPELARKKRRLENLVEMYREVSGLDVKE